MRTSLAIQGRRDANEGEIIEALLKVGADVRIARSPAEFVRAIEECVREACDPVRAPEHIARRRAVAWNNTWEKRVRQIADLLDIGICEYRSSSHPRSARNHA